MKKLFITSLVILLCAQAQAQLTDTSVQAIELTNINSQLENTKSFDLSPATLRRAVTAAIRQSGHVDAAGRPQIYIVKQQKSLAAQGRTETQVMGYTEKQILEMVDDENGGACSTAHLRGDPANRWCHAAVVKAVDRSLQSNGMKPELAAAIAASIFITKEYGIDKNRSLSDMVVADYKVYSDRNNSIEVTVFADKVIFITARKQF